MIHHLINKTGILSVNNNKEFTQSLLCLFVKWLIKHSYPKVVILEEIVLFIKVTPKTKQIVNKYSYQVKRVIIFY